MKKQIIKFFENKKILILGYGKEGKSAYKFLKENDVLCEIGIADKYSISIDDSNVKIYQGDNYLESVKDYDIVIKSPGVIIKDYLSELEKEKITSLTDLFFRFCPNKIVGVTGTKGKSTTSSLIYTILKENGFDTYLIGNIGLPCFDIIDKIKQDTVLVYELSCHQLEYIKASPHIAVLLNIYEEHLDHYVSINEYVKAKTNIYKYQGDEDYLIYGDIWNYLDFSDLEQINSKLISIFGNTIDIDKNSIRTSLIGEHNKNNIITAIMVANLLGVPLDNTLEPIKNFKPLEHRLEYVGEYRGINFYNDSIATAQEAVINAVESLPETKTIIIGGMDRGIDYTTLVEFLSTSSVENIILLPNTSNKILDLFKLYTHDKNIIVVNDMNEAVKMSYHITKENEICLLSPAAASYGFYTNFEQRGHDFKRLVKQYSNKL